MSGIPALGAAGGQSAAAVRPADRATLAVSKALQATRHEGDAMRRLIEEAGGTGKGGHVDYRA